MKKPKLVCSAKPGQHRVEMHHVVLNRRGYLVRFDDNKKQVETGMYVRLRKKTFIEQPSFKAFMTAIFRLAHDRLQQADEAD